MSSCQPFAGNLDRSRRQSSWYVDDVFCNHGNMVISIRLRGSFLLMMFDYRAVYPHFVPHRTDHA